MDYVEWVERLLSAIRTAWQNLSDEDTRLIGADMQDVLNALDLSIDSRQPEFESGALYRAILNGLDDLKDMGWVEEPGFWRFRPTDTGRKLPADQSAVWEYLIEQTPLDDDQLALLEAVNTIGEERLP